MQPGGGAATVATVPECRAALEMLAARLDAYGGEVRGRRVPDRTLGCTLLDLDVTFHAQLRDGRLEDITTDRRPKPQIRVLCSSADLLALVAGDLGLAHAWGTGRLRLDASLRDLIRLRTLV